MAKQRKKKIRQLKLPKGTVDGKTTYNHHGKKAGGDEQSKPPAPDDLNDYDPTHVEYNPTNDSDFTGGGK